MLPNIPSYLKPLASGIGGQVEEYSSESSRVIQDKLKCAGERWESGFTCFCALQDELDRRKREKRRRSRKAKEVSGIK